MVSMLQALQSENLDDFRIFYTILSVEKGLDKIPERLKIASMNTFFFQQQSQRTQTGSGCGRVELLGR
jgi:hypothetical protein